MRRLLNIQHDPKFLRSLDEQVDHPLDEPPLPPGVVGIWTPHTQEVSSAAAALPLAMPFERVGL